MCIHYSNVSMWCDHVSYISFDVKSLKNMVFSVMFKNDRKVTVWVQESILTPTSDHFVRCLYMSDICPSGVMTSLSMICLSKVVKIKYNIFCKKCRNTSPFAS